jgi:hypothetical protein
MASLAADTAMPQLIPIPPRPTPTPTTAFPVPVTASTTFFLHFFFFEKLFIKLTSKKKKKKKKKKKSAAAAAAEPPRHSHSHDGVPCAGHGHAAAGASAPQPSHSHSHSHSHNGEPCRGHSHGQPMDILAIADEWDREPRMARMQDGVLARIRGSGALRATDKGYEYTAGTGVIGLALVKDGLVAHMTMGNSNHNMAEIIRLRASKNGFPDKVKALHTPDPHGTAGSPTYDLAVSSLTLHTVPAADKPKFLAAMRGSLLPGGRALVFELADDAASQALLEGGRHGPQPSQESATRPADLEAWLKEAGFSSVERMEDVKWAFDPRLPSDITILAFKAEV